MSRCLFLPLRQAPALVQAFRHGLQRHLQRGLGCCVALPSTSLAVLAAPLPVQAGPHLYANSFGYNSSQANCLDATRKVLIQAGFSQSDIEKTVYTDKDKRDVQNGWTASHPTENITAVFECDARNGMGAMAVSGANDDATYEVYSKLWDLFLK